MTKFTSTPGYRNARDLVESTDASVDGLRENLRCALDVIETIEGDAHARVVSILRRETPGADLDALAAELIAAVRGGE